MAVLPLQLIRIMRISCISSLNLLTMPLKLMTDDKNRNQSRVQLIPAVMVCSSFVNLLILPLKRMTDNKKRIEVKLSTIHLISNLFHLLMVHLRGLQVMRKIFTSWIDSLVHLASSANSTDAFSLVQPLRSACDR